MKDQVDKIQEWKSCVEEIKNFTYQLMSDRALFRRYMEIVKSNKSIQNPPDFHQWVFRNYAQALAMKIRMQLDPSGITIRRLLEDIVKNPGYITREWFTSMYTPLEVGDMKINFGDSDFTKIAGEGNSFDLSTAEIDIKNLISLGTNIKTYVDKRLAHYIVHVKVKEVKIEELDKFVDEFEEIVKKYILLFTASYNPSMTPIWQYDWEEIFQYKWIE